MIFKNNRPHASEGPLLYNYPAPMRAGQPSTTRQQLGDRYEVPASHQWEIQTWAWDMELKDQDGEKAYLLHSWRPKATQMKALRK